MSEHNKALSRNFERITKLQEAEQQMGEGIGLLTHYMLANSEVNLEAVDLQIDQIVSLAWELTGSVPRPVVEQVAKILRELRQRDRAAGLR